MNRLTERLPNGVVRAPVTDENRGDSCMMRLAAYEDTGLMPEEVAELAAANKDGRVVVLPCKAGDTVYALWRTVYGVYEIIEGRIFECYIDKDDSSMYFSDASMSHSLWIKLDDFGKTVFLTRAEAEAALKGDSK